MRSLLVSLIGLLLLTSVGCLTTKAKHDAANFTAYDAADGLKQAKHDTIPVFTPAKVTRHHQVENATPGSKGQKWYLETTEELSEVMDFYDKQKLESNNTVNGFVYTKSLDSRGVSTLIIEVLNDPNKTDEPGTKFTILEVFNAIHP